MKPRVYEPVPRVWRDMAMAWCRSGRARRVRRSAGLTQGRFAALLVDRKVSGPAISRWESGTRGPASEDLARRYVLALDDLARRYAKAFSE